MDVNPMRPSGLWLPLVTPFNDGALDETSLRRLLRHYAAQPVDGFILAATTGEGLTLDDDETARLVSIAAAEIGDGSRDIPIYLGLSGSDTRKVVKAIERSSGWPLQGYLIACPYYVRPSQAGLIQHFTALAESAPRPIMIYNIPYRTGVNLENAAMLRLAAHPNIAGVKDCCADAEQSFDLLRQRPKDFAVLTGEDAFFYSALAQGADGGILMSAHVAAGDFATLRNKLRAGDQAGALADWYTLSPLPQLLFAEPSPAPVKHWLWRLGLIDSPEVRLPVTGISDALAQRIDRVIEGSPLVMTS